jgi:hypothetical protein
MTMLPMASKPRGDNASVGLMKLLAKFVVAAEPFLDHAFYLVPILVGIPGTSGP